MPLYCGTVQSALEEGPRPEQSWLLAWFTDWSGSPEVFSPKSKSAADNQKGNWMAACSIYLFYLMHILIKHLLCAKFIRVLWNFLFWCVRHVSLDYELSQNLLQTTKIYYCSWLYGLAGLTGWFFYLHDVNKSRRQLEAWWGLDQPWWALHVAV